MTAAIQHEFKSGTGFFRLFTTVVVAERDVARTDAIQVGSRIDYRLLMAGPANNIQQFQTLFKQQQQAEKQSANPNADESPAPHLPIQVLWHFL